MVKKALSICAIVAALGGCQSTVTNQNKDTRLHYSSAVWRDVFGNAQIRAIDDIDSDGIVDLVYLSEPVFNGKKYLDILYLEAHGTQFPDIFKKADEILKNTCDSLEYTFMNPDFD